MTQQKQLTKRQDVVSQVMSQVSKMQSSGQLVLPKNYSAKNALMSAWLVLQNTQTKDKQPVLQACNHASIANALMEMVVFGLNPAKRQCYFIPYGKHLIMQVSRYGYEAMAKRSDPRIDKIVAEVVWEGDEFEYEIQLGKKIITKHKQSLTNKNNKPIGAYCVLLDKNGAIIKTEIMTFEQIKQAWMKSPVKPVQNGEVKAGSTHAEFIEEMCKKTIIRRACKSIIQSADDSYLFEAQQEQSVENKEAEMENIIEAETASQDFDEQVSDAKQPQPIKKGPPQEEEIEEEPGF